MTNAEPDCRKCARCARLGCGTGTALFSEQRPAGRLVERDVLVRYTVMLEETRARDAEARILVVETAGRRLRARVAAAADGTPVFMDWRRADGEWSAR